MAEPVGDLVVDLSLEPTGAGCTESGDFRRAV